MVPVTEIEVIIDKGILGNRRYFNRRSSSTGLPTKRQVSLIEREQIAEHSATLGLESIPPGVVRSNIETAGIALLPLLGRTVMIGEAVLRFEIPRDPCHKMDQICDGLRHLMEDNRQGVLATVVTSGKIRVGDKIYLVTESPP